MNLRDGLPLAGFLPGGTACQVDYAQLRVRAATTKAIHYSKTQAAGANYVAEEII